MGSSIAVLSTSLHELLPTSVSRKTGGFSGACRQRSGMERLGGAAARFDHAGPPQYRNRRVIQVSRFWVRYEAIGVSSRVRRRVMVRSAEKMKKPFVSVLERMLQPVE